MTRNEALDITPLWTPNSERIIFGSTREGANTSIYSKSAIGTGDAEWIASMQDGHLWPESLSRNGDTLFVQFRNPRGDLDIGMLSMEGDRTVKLLLQGEFTEANPRISPDERWLAYSSNESGQHEVCIRPFPDLDSGEREQASTNRGRSPLWSPDGKTLFYRSRGEIIAVSVETDPTLKLGKPKSLFPDIYNSGWDIHPDGKRFLMIKRPETTEDESLEERPRKINIVLNWFEELKERVPVE